jgi:hypothetical protein
LFILPVPFFSFLFCSNPFSFKLLSRRFSYSHFHQHFGKAKFLTKGTGTLQFVNIYISFYAANLIDNALQPGDLILTGTPSGVGPVVAGDIITGRHYIVT